MRKGLLFFCVLFLTLQNALCVCAEEVSGSIRLSLPGGNLMLYRVGEITDTGDGPGYTPAGEFANWQGSLADLSSPDLARDLAAFAAENRCSCLSSAAAEDGNILFSDLQAGLYLLVQTEAAPGYEIIPPFLVSVPESENGSGPAHIDASPKYQLTPLPTQPLPSLPQTGQNNWPVPVLFVSGIALFLTGLFLQRRRHA